VSVPVHAVIGERMTTGAGRFGRLTQSKERQHDHNNYDHADDVKYVVHRTLPSAAVSTVEDKKGSSAHAHGSFRPVSRRLCKPSESADDLDHLHKGSIKQCAGIASQARCWEDRAAPRSAKASTARS
jgi:hypothetical protein